MNSLLIWLDFTQGAASQAVSLTKVSNLESDLALDAWHRDFCCVPASRLEENPWVLLLMDVESG